MITSLHIGAVGCPFHSTYDEMHDPFILNNRNTELGVGVIGERTTITIAAGKQNELSGVGEIRGLLTLLWLTGWKYKVKVLRGSLIENIQNCCLHALPHYGRE